MPKGAPRGTITKALNLTESLEIPEERMTRTNTVRYYTLGEVTIPPVRAAKEISAPVRDDEADEADSAEYREP
jgi:hypothetical protein